MISWNTVSGATNYGVYVRDVTTDTLVYDNDYVGNTTSVTLSSALTAGHAFRWNMRASNSAGLVLTQATFTFRRKPQSPAPRHLCRPAPVPAPAQRSPRSRQR